MRNLRIVLAGMGVSLTGLIMGAFAGASAAGIVVGALAGFDAVGGPLPIVGAVFGAVLGAVLAPLAAFTMLRHVPLWRLFAEVTAGTILGSVAAALVNLNPNLVLLGAVGGFFAAGFRLARRTAHAQLAQLVAAGDARPGTISEVRIVRPHPPGPDR